MTETDKKPDTLPKVPYTKEEKEAKARQSDQEGGNSGTAAFMRKQARHSEKLPEDPGPKAKDISQN